MKATFILGLLLAPLAFATPIAEPEAGEGGLLEKRCNYNAVTACTNACGLDPCRSCNGNPSCLAACNSSSTYKGWKRCKNCCAARCVMC